MYLIDEQPEMTAEMWESLANLDLPKAKGMSGVIMTDKHGDWTKDYSAIVEHETEWNSTTEFQRAPEPDYDNSDEYDNVYDEDLIPEEYPDEDDLPYDPDEEDEYDDYDLDDDDEYDDLEWYSY